MKKFALLLSVLALAMFGFTACGDDDDGGEASEDTTPTTVETETTTDGGGSADAGGGSVDVSAAPDSIAYEQSELSAPAGEVTINFDNPSQIPHDVVIEDADGNEVTKTEVITGDSTSTSGEFEAGEYTFYCSVDGHRDQGMEGPLTVQ